MSRKLKKTARQLDESARGLATGRRSQRASFGIGDLVQDQAELRAVPLGVVQAIRVSGIATLDS
jgi:hypothetical protein